MGGVGNEVEGGLVDYKVIARDGVAAVSSGQLLDGIGCGSVYVLPPIEGVACGNGLPGSVGGMNGEVEGDGGVAAVGVES